MTNYDYSQADNTSTGEFQIIPKGTIAMATLVIKRHNVALGQYAKPCSDPAKSILNIKLTIAGGEYKGRILFDMIAVRDSDNNSVWMNISRGKIKSILEGSRNPILSHPDGYKLVDPSFAHDPGSEAHLGALDNFGNGVLVAIKVGVRENTYNGETKDVNTVTYLSPMANANDFAEARGGQPMQPQQSMQPMQPQQPMQQPQQPQQSMQPMQPQQPMQQPMQQPQQPMQQPQQPMDTDDIPF